MEFLINAGMVILAAFLSGLLARALRLPVLLGYLIAGIIVGPNTPGVVVDMQLTQAVANLGVALLMFAVGVQLQLSDMNAIRRTALGGGTFQVLACILAGWLASFPLGWSQMTGIFAGGALALSSTAVVMRVMEDRGEMGTGHAKAMLGISVVQDLSLVVMVALVPSVASGTFDFMMVGGAILRAAVFIAGAILFALHVAPYFLGQVARARSRELFLLAIIVLCLGAAAIADMLGLGVALGAFFAGLVVSTSSFAQEVFSQVRPLRDVFASIFFVSVGMLIDPTFVVNNFGMVLAFTALIVIVKPITVMLPMRALNWSGRSLFLTGIGLGQVGEFSFVLASMGEQQNAVQPEVVSVILSGAVLSLMIAPFAMQHAGWMYRHVAHRRLLRGFFHGHRDDPIQAGIVERHPDVVVLGGGRIGRYVSDSLRELDIPHAVIDFDKETLDRFSAAGVCTVFGDASSEIVLRKAFAFKAKMAVISLSDMEATLMAYQELRRHAPDMYIVMRLRRGEDIPRVRAMGVNAVIHGEFEAGAEVIRQTLRHLGVERDDVRRLIEEARTVHYRQEEPRLH